ncbi:MAG: ABC transporter permease [Clostridia bacterium]|nr:ABC transporter permease [Clostridia bacterium]
MKALLTKGKAGQVLKKLAPLLIYVAMVLVFTAIKPQYLTLSNFTSILVQTSMLGIIAGGMTLVMMTGGADLSVGAVAGASTLAGLWPVVFGDSPLVVGILIALGVALALGAINGACISWLGVAPFVATLGTMFLAQGFQYVFSEGGLSISYGFPDAFKFIGGGSLGPIPMPIVIFTVVFAVLLILTEFSPFGRYLRGTGLNQFTSELSGVRIRFYTFISYVLCSLLAAVLGLVLGSFQSYVSPDHGSTFLMDSLMVVLLGKALVNNRISVYATAFGALLLCSFESGLAMVGIPVTVLNVCKGALLVIILLVSVLPQLGLFRKKRTQ